MCGYTYVRTHTYTCTTTIDYFSMNLNGGKLKFYFNNVYKSYLKSSVK